MSEIPPFPNSVNAQPPNTRHQIHKIEVQQLKASEVNTKREVVETFYDSKTYIYKNGEFSTTTPKATGQRILVTV
tara:strand:- start:502 stop:726 length:225 start_codon:yes stop_codon:yes gene_type:complete